MWLLLPIEIVPAFSKLPEWVVAQEQPGEKRCNFLSVVFQGSHCFFLPVDSWPLCCCHLAAQHLLLAGVHRRPGSGGLSYLPLPVCLPACTRWPLFHVTWIQPFLIPYSRDGRDFILFSCLFLCEYSPLRTNGRHGGYSEHKRQRGLILPPARKAL